MVELPLSVLFESETNPRQSYDKGQMSELTASVKAQGIITPLLARKVKDKFEIIAGSRRFRAATAAKLDTVPVIVRDLDDQQTLELQVIENEQRADVHPLEQCAAYARLQLTAKLSVDEIANRIGKTRQHVRQRMQYLKLIEPAKKAFLIYRIWASHADQLARLQPAQQKEAMSWIKDDGETMSPGSLAVEIERAFFLLLKDAPFPTNDPHLVAKAGPCLVCPKRTGFSDLLFPDVPDKDTCTDPKCFQEKCSTFVKTIVAANPKAMNLTIGGAHYYNGATKPKGLTGWVKAGNQKCPAVKEGVVVEILDRFPNERQIAKLGALLRFCDNPKCKTHHDIYSGGSYKASESDKKAERERKVELKRRMLLFRAIVDKPLPMSRDDERAMLEWMIDSLDNDTARQVCKAMTWEPAKHNQRGFSYNDGFRETIRRNLKDTPPPKLPHWIVLMFIAAKDLWFFSHTSVPKASVLETKAKNAGVPIGDIAKQAKEPTKKQPEPAAKKAAKK